MHFYSIKHSHLQKIFSWIIMILFLSPTIILSQTDSTTRNTDDIKRLRKKYKHKKLADEIAAFPGKAIFFPVKLGLKGVQQGIKIYDESKIGARLIDLLTSDDGLRGLYPTYSSRNGYGIGVYQKGFIGNESKLSLVSAFGMGKRQNYELRFKRIRLGNRHFLGDAQLAFTSLSDEDFYGIGPGTSKTDEVDYGFDQAVIRIMVGMKPHRKLMINLSGSFEMNSVYDPKKEENTSISNRFSAATLPGFKENLQMVSVETNISYDSKNRQVKPTHGFELMSNGGIYKDVQNNEYGFWKFQGEMFKYMHLFYNRVLIFRIKMESNTSLDKKAIPFYYLAEAGSDGTIRGFKRGRFRDRDFFAASIDYRYPLVHAIDGYVFMDAGRVANDLVHEFNEENLQITAGAGIKIWSKESLVAQIYLARSEDGWRFNFKLN